MEKRTPEFKIVKLDETENWDIQDLPAIEAIREIYLVDFNTNTYLCEMTPSLWLDFLDIDIVYKEGTTEEERDTAEEVIYNGHSGLAMYMHKSQLTTPSDKIEITAVEWGDIDWMSEFDVDDLDQYNKLLAEAHQAISEDGCYW